MFKIQYKINNNKEEYVKLFKYYDNGIVKEILQYQNNRLNGISYTYYPNKKLKKKPLLKMINKMELQKYIMKMAL